MAVVRAYRGLVPVVGKNVYLADDAVILGEVEIGDDASIWFGAVLRGDEGLIRIGARTNVQDLCTVHATGGVSRTIVGSDVTVGHNCVLHGCEIADRVLVGMGSILLDNVVVGEESVIAAGTLLTSRVVVPPRSLVMGRPGRVIRELEPAERGLGLQGAEHYVTRARQYLGLAT